MWTEDGQCAGGKGACLFNFQVTGTVARRLYEAMRARVEEDLCTEGEMKTDKASGLHCYKAGSGEYGCYFGYDAAKKKMTAVQVSC